MGLTKWAEYQWPEWVPESLRETIESFWADSYGRGPDAWEASASGKYNPPALGLRLGDRGCFWTTSRSAVVGRWVHKWNNIHAVVLDDGTWVTVFGMVDDSSLKSGRDSIASRLAALRSEVLKMEAAERDMDAVALMIGGE